MPAESMSHPEPSSNEGLHTALVLATPRQAELVVAAARRLLADQEFVRFELPASLPDNARVLFDSMPRSGMTGPFEHSLTIGGGAVTLARSNEIIGEQRFRYSPSAPDERDQGALVRELYWLPSDDSGAASTYETIAEAAGFAEPPPPKPIDVAPVVVRDAGNLIAFLGQLSARIT